MKRFKLLIVAALSLAFLTPAFAQEYGVQWTRVAQHQTSNTTYTPVSATVRLHTLVINCSNAGTTWIITVRNKEGTPKILYTTTLTLGTTTVLALPVGIVMTSGIDITFSGTAGVADIWLTYR